MVRRSPFFTALVLAVGCVSWTLSSPCPGGIALVDTFVLDDVVWSACEDLEQPGGSIALVGPSAQVEWFTKSHEQYGSAAPGIDDDYYLNLTKKTVIAAKSDILGQTLLAGGDMTWERVASAVPPIRRAGVRGIIGSRGSVSDTTFNDAGEDATGYGFPPALNFVFDLTNTAEGGAPFGSVPNDKRPYINASLMAAGLVGGHLPIVVFYYPVTNGSQYLPSDAKGERYWTMIASAEPDMKGSREQTVWFRYQQVQCAGIDRAPPCELVGSPQYWDTYWWSRAAGNGATTNITGPANATSSNGFYKSLLVNRLWWDAELDAERMMQLSLPSPSSTNGTWLLNQMHHQIIQGMITWHNTWGPRYGVLPGYGYRMQNGFEDTFTATAMGALEVGAMPYARGLIDHYWTNYVRYDGLINYRAEELAQQARMLTILSLYHSYTGGDDIALLLAHFGKAKAMADWLVARRNASLVHDPADPRYGILPGTDEGDDYKVQFEHQTPQSHWYAANAEAYRAFAELGAVWVEIGKAASRIDVAAHGEELLRIAPLLYRDLHISLNKTVSTTASPGHRCYPHRADGYGSYTGCSFRSYPEMFYSGALTMEQTDAMYISGQGSTTCEVGKWMEMGTSSGDTGGALMFVHTPQGLPFGLLQHDMVDRFLLYFFTQSAHSATRGTYVTPESQTVDRNTGGYPYASPGQANVAMAMKWMLCYEEPETRTLWLAKATPRDWLEQGEAALVATNLTTRYGRISYTLAATATGATSYTVKASVTLPPSFVTAAPSGGIRLRLRSPAKYAGMLSGVMVGGKEWDAFNAAEETIDFSADNITAALLRDGLPHIVATFAGAKVPLRPAHVDLRRRVVPLASSPHHNSVPEKLPATTPQDPRAMPKCPDGMTQVDTFEINSTGWAACEDLQQPDGAIALVSSAGEGEWFSKSYEPYLTNASDSNYYLGLGQGVVANASTDVLGAKLLAGNVLSWAAVERAIPPIRASGPDRQSAMQNCHGTRTFIGSRSSVVDISVDDFGCGPVFDGHHGTPGLSMNLYNDAVGEPRQTYDTSGTADGIVGNVLPTSLIYLPMQANGTSKFRYWTAFTVPVADMGSSLEQSSWTRYQQIKCSGLEMKPPCQLVTAQYWDTYWFSRYPGANATDTQKETLRTGPVAPASADGFYQTLLESRRWWGKELDAEGMMQLSLPSPASTNGTWLALQATHAIVKSMISRERKWHPRYGIKPGYGFAVYNGLLEVFTATATAALEFGAMPYAQGVIDNYFRFYVRNDGRVWHRSAEIPASARMLTVLALSHDYSGGNSSFALTYFTKAKAVAELLVARYIVSLGYGDADPRFGIPEGQDDALHPAEPLDAHIRHEAAPAHWYGSAAELYRACTEMGRVWYAIGKSMQREDVAAHGSELLKLAPQIYTQLHASLNKTVQIVGSRRCWPATAHNISVLAPLPSFRGYAEMLYSGAMTQQQVSDIYIGASGSTCGNRLFVLGSPALTDGGIAAASLSTTTPYGLAYGLLQYDLVDRFLLHYFTMSAHAYTRGSWTTPESTNVVDRDVPTAAFAAAGEVITPTYLKWMLCYEEPETHTLWLAKATPRDWLAPGEAALVATNLTTRYGRISYTIAVVADVTAAGYMVQASVTLPPSFATSAPDGGIRLRLRTPAEHTGKLSGVTLGGKEWDDFNAAKETIDFAAGTLTAALIRDGLPHIVATFA